MKPLTIEQFKERLKDRLEQLRVYQQRSTHAREQVHQVQEQVDDLQKQMEALSPAKDKGE